jgi:hypothetical protein
MGGGVGIMGSIGIGSSFLHARNVTIIERKAMN